MNCATNSHGAVKHDITPDLTSDFLETEQTTRSGQVAQRLRPHSWKRMTDGVPPRKTLSTFRSMSGTNILVRQLGPAANPRKPAHIQCSESGA